MKEKNKNIALLLSFFSCSWFAFFISLPMCMVILYGIESLNELSFQMIFKAYINSVLISVISAFICLIIAYPFSYYIFFMNEKAKTLILIGTMFVCCTPLIVKVYIWTNMINPYILPPFISVILCMVYAYLPFMVIPVYMSIFSIRNFIASANYVNEKFAFSKVVLPLSIKRSLQGAKLIMMSMTGECFVPEISGQGRITTLSTIMWEQFAKNRNLAYVSSLTVYFILLSFCFLLLLEKIFLKNAKI